MVNHVLNQRFNYYYEAIKTLNSKLTSEKL